MVQLNMYAELIGNYKNQRIKSLQDNKLTLEVLGLTAEERRMLMGGDEEVGYALRSGADMPSFALLK